VYCWDDSSSVSRSSKISFTTWGGTGNMADHVTYLMTTGSPAHKLLHNTAVNQTVIQLNH
jgi:hypothetical protein